jgi:hypothetical protein
LEQGIIEHGHLTDDCVGEHNMQDKSVTWYKMATDVFLAPTVLATESAEQTHTAGSNKPCEAMKIPSTGAFTPLVNCYARVTGHLNLLHDDPDDEPDLGAVIYLSTDGATAVVNSTSIAKMKRWKGSYAVPTCVPIDYLIPLDANKDYIIKAGHYSSTTGKVKAGVGSSMFVQLVPR